MKPDSPTPRALLCALSAAALFACGDSASDASDVTAAPDQTTGADTAPADVAATGGDGVIDCAALAALLITEPTPSVADWTGYWTCWQADHACDGTQCSWTDADLDAYVLDGDCAAASSASCEADGATVAHCALLEDTGAVTVDCSEQGVIAITAEGLPDHPLEQYASSGELPPFIGSAATPRTWELTATPTVQADVTLFTDPGTAPGVLANGVALFNQFTGVGTVAVADEVVDDCGGHPANGQYHYHAAPACGRLAAAAVRGAPGQHSGLMGLALDGFPILGPYGYADPDDPGSAVVNVTSCWLRDPICDGTQVDCYTYDEDARAAGACHLDMCNGRVTAVPPALQAALGERIYAYYLTVDDAGEPAFPFVPYCFRGAYEGGGGGPPGGGGPGGGGPPQR